MAVGQFMQRAARVVCSRRRNVKTLAKD